MNHDKRDNKLADLSEEDVLERIKDRKIVQRTGTFSAELVEQSAWFRSRPDTKFLAYENVLRPLLQVATECWVYGLKETSPAFRAAKGLLKADKGKWQVKLDGDPIKGHLRFWNASAGLRGSIIIVIPQRKFESARVFRHCHEAFVFTNPRSGHTPAAINYVRQRVQTSDDIAVCFPGCNGINWMDIHMKPKLAVAMLEQAGQICGWK